MKSHWRRGTARVRRGRSLSAAIAISVAACLSTLSTASGTVSASSPAVVTPRTSPTTTYAVIKTVPVGDGPTEVAVNNVDDTVYVSNADDSTVSVINGRVPDDSVTISVGWSPEGVAVNQSDDTVYVALDDTDSTPGFLSVMNGPALRDDSSTIGVDLYPLGVAVDQSDDTVYVANCSSNTLSVMNGSAPRDDSFSVGVGDCPWLMAVNNLDDTVYVTNISDGTLSAINGRHMDDSVAIGVGTAPWGVAVDQSDDTVYVANHFDGTLSAMKGSAPRDDSVTIGVGQGPEDVAVDQSDHTVYVVNYDDSSVSVIDGRALDDSVTVDLAPGSGPEGVAIDDSGVNAGLAYVTNYDDNAVSVIGRVTPSLMTPAARVGASVTVSLDAPQAAYDVDGSTVQRVLFGGSAGTGLAAGAGDTWTVTAPRGSGTVPVTVELNGGLTASAGDFTYVPRPTYPPGAPTGATAVAGDRSASVSWTPPSYPGTFPISSYLVMSAPDGKTCEAQAPATTCTVDGLTNATTYTFAVAASNAVGWGAASAPSNAVTPLAPVVASIVITGSRGASDSHRVHVEGSTTGLVGAEVTPYVKLAGQPAYVAGVGKQTVDPMGAFAWQRKTGKKVYVYFTSGTTRSNRVIIAAG